MCLFTVQKGTYRRLKGILLESNLPPFIIHCKSMCYEIVNFERLLTIKKGWKDANFPTFTLCLTKDAGPTPPYPLRQV